MGEIPFRPLPPSQLATKRAFQMPSTTPRKSNLTALLQTAPGAGNAAIVRDSDNALHQLQRLNDAEIITLFTPLVPHPPATALAKNMDPFEPLGRSLPRQVRHVPYRLDYGMTETHADFLSSTGAVVVVVCSTENVLRYDGQAFERQAKFARDVFIKTHEEISSATIPIVILLITESPSSRSHVSRMNDFPSLVTLDDYSPAALSNAVGIMLGN